MKKILLLTLLLASLAAAQPWPGSITYTEGRRYDDPYSSIAVIGRDTIYVSSRGYHVHVGDTLQVHWLPQGNADLAGYNLVLISGSSRVNTWLPLASVTIDSTVSASRKLYLEPGYYYAAVDAQDLSGNRSSLSVAVMLQVRAAGLLPPRLVKIVIHGLAR